MIRWLHISDLHIKDRADWNNFEQELWEKCKEFEKIDFVIVTGDFHNFWEKEDFHLAKEFLLELMKRLKLNIEKDLFLVPGNHDGVTNVKCKSAHIEALNRNPLDDEAPENFQALEEAFHDYEKFIKDMIPNYPVKHPAATHIRCWNDRINFVHCNTAIGADGKKKDMQLMNVDELAKNSLPREQTNIVLAHNSFDDIDERVQKRMQDWMRVNHVNAYLCGDRHRRELANIELDKKRNIRIPCIVSYKSAPDPTDDYSEFGIIIGEWENGKAQLRGWIWKSGEGFKNDGEITDTEILMCEEAETSETRKQEKETQEGVKQKEIKHYDCCSQDSKLQKKDREAQLMYGFIRYYHKMTPHMFIQFNAAYRKTGWEMKENYTETELFEYVTAIKEAGKLEELAVFIRNLI